MSIFDCPQCQLIGGLCAMHLAALCHSEPKGPFDIWRSRACDAIHLGLTLPKPETCDREFHPLANANGDCQQCGQLIGHHKMAQVDLEAEARAYAAMVARLNAEPRRQPLPQGTPIRWYHRLWWRLLSWVRRVGG